MNPCFWTPTGIDSDFEPCRTICGNGFLDIEEECERLKWNTAAAGTLTGIQEDVCIDYDQINDPDSYTIFQDSYNKDYCSDSCQCKAGWEINPAFDRDVAISTSNMPCRTVCNNNVLDPWEECEPGIHNNATNVICSSSCQCLEGFEINPLFVRNATYVAGTSPTPCTPVCGNNVVNQGEECEIYRLGFDDDNNAGTNADTDSNIYCSTSCQCKDGWEINPAFN